MLVTVVPCEGHYVEEQGHFGNPASDLEILHTP
jgi:hypothetical protein